MSEPTFSAPVMAKIIAGLGGFIGGAAFMLFYKPKNVWDAAVRSSVSTTVAIIGCNPLLEWLGISHKTDNVLAAAAFLGFVSWTLVSLLARFLVNVHDERVTLKLPFIEKKK